MKKNNFYKRSTVWLSLLLIACMACNKEGQSITYAMEVVINGYNGSDHALQVSIDTTAYDATVRNGALIIKPASLIQFSTVYSYIPNRQPPIVLLTDTVTGKIVFRRPLPAGGTKAGINYIYIDGKEEPLQTPAADNATNTLGFYIRFTENDTPFDIFLYRRDNNTGEEYRKYLARSVKPNTWIFVNYIADDVFGDKNVLSSAANIYFTKTGTTDQWAFQESESRSRMPASGLSLPLTGEKGLVQSYFLMPGDQGLERSRLFFYPDRIW